jgi:hypothetical protein
MQTTMVTSFLERQCRSGVYMILWNYKAESFEKTFKIGVPPSLQPIPWSRVHLEKLTVAQLVKKSPTFYRIWWLITKFTRIRHWSLFWARLIQSIPTHCIFKINFNITLPSTPKVSKEASFLWVCWLKPCIYFLLYICFTCLPFLIWSL